MSFLFGGSKSKSGFLPIDKAKVEGTATAGQKFQTRRRPGGAAPEGKAAEGLLGSAPLSAGKDRPVGGGGLNALSGVRNPFGGGSQNFFGGGGRTGQNFFGGGRSAFGALNVGVPRRINRLGSTI